MSQQRVRIVIRAQGTLRAPAGIVATIQDAKGIGASEYYNDAGELFFTLPNNHTAISAVLPWETHWALEEYTGEGWKEKNAGWIVDMDSTDEETIFYGLDYLGVLGTMVDERFNPDLSPDVAAELYPSDPTGVGGAKYVENTITEIVSDQLARAIAGDDSPLGFFDSVSVVAMTETVTIYCTFKERLSFIKGLLDSHRAGTGKRTRLRVVKTLTWSDPLTYTAAYSFEVADNPGTDRDNLVLKYGRLVQGYRTIPFGDFGTRVLAIGKTPLGYRLEYTSALTPPPTGEVSTYNETRYGRLPKLGFYQDIADVNDLKRRAAQQASEVGAIGKALGIGLRTDVLGIKDGWDICDSFPVDIQRPPVDTTTWGDGLWTCWGWAAVFNDDGHTDTVLTFLPKAVTVSLDPGLETSDPVIRTVLVEVHDSDPVDPATDANVTWINSVTGHIWQVDPETGLWVDMTALGTYSAIGTAEPVPFAHGNMGATETLNYDDGTWHTGTLTANCAITVSGFDVSKGQVMLGKITQDGTGGWAIAWDTDVIFAGDDQPGQAAGAVTWFLLWSDEGDTVIYGSKIGAGGLTISDEGTPLATLAESLDFVGDGVVVSGTGVAKTVTISGVTEAAVQAVGHYELLMAAGSSPVEPLETGDGLDWLYVWVTS